jgi:general secretion pathway protein L
MDDRATTRDYPYTPHQKSKMRQSLLIRLHGDINQHISWATFDSAGHLLENAHDVPLNTVPRHNRPPFVLIPSTDIVLTQADVPSKQWKRIVQAVPYVLEEQLAEDVEDLHFALGKREPISGDIAVAVIARRQIEAYLQQLNTVGLTPASLIPDIFAVPKPIEGWNLLYLDNIVLVRTGLQTGFAIETDCLSVALQLALTEHQANPPQQLTVFTGTQPATTLTDLHAYSIPIIEKTNDKSVLAWLAQGLIDDKPLNLLQNHYRAQDKIAILWRPWRLTAALLILWGALFMAKQWIDYRQLNQQRQALNAQIETVYRDTFPQARKIVNPRVQMEQKLKALRAEGNATQNEHFLSLFNKISTPLARTPGFQIKRIDYNQKHLDIQLTVANLQALEYLKQRLTRLDLTVEINQAISRNNQVDSRLRITSM